jgi:pyruvate formate-lyase activating enzyme-like uncharacterized protein
VALRIGTYIYSGLPQAAMYYAPTQLYVFVDDFEHVVQTCLLLKKFQGTQTHFCSSPIKYSVKQQQRCFRARMRVLQSK